MCRKHMPELHSYLKSSSQRRTHGTSGRTLNTHIQGFHCFAVAKLWPKHAILQRCAQQGGSMCEDQRQVPACRASPCQEECSQFCADSLYLPLWKASNSCSYCWAATSCTTVCSMTTQPDVHPGFHDSLQRPVRLWQQGAVLLRLLYTTRGGHPLQHT